MTRSYNRELRVQVIKVSEDSSHGQQIGVDLIYDIAFEYLVVAGRQQQPQDWGKLLLTQFADYVVVCMCIHVYIRGKTRHS